MQNSEQIHKRILPVDKPNFWRAIRALFALRRTDKRRNPEVNDSDLERQIQKARAHLPEILSQWRL